MVGAVVLGVGEVPPYLPVLATIVVSAAVAGWICQRIGLVPIVGFLVAGVLVGPNALGIVDQIDTVEVAAEVGVILLLFAIGIEFSLDRLARLKKLVIGGGALTVLFATVVAAGVVMLTGGGLRPAIYTGLLVSVSSTAVVLSLLATRHETGSPAGQLSIAVLVFEDLAVVGMVLLVPMLGTEGGSTAELIREVVVAVAVIVGVLVVARRVMPKVLESVARLCSPEVFLLAVLAICFATAYVTSLAGVSVSLGAFLAGLVVSESRFSSHALGEVLPLQIVFTATFFVSVGMLLDPRFLVDEPLLILAIVVGVVLIKAFTGTVAARLVGVALPVALASAFVRAQIGEFSFVLQQVGNDAGLSPGDLGDDGVQAFLAGSVLLMILTPALGPLGERVGSRFGRTETVPRLVPQGIVSVERSDHVIVAGYGTTARQLVPALREADIPFVVLTLSPEGARHAERMGLPLLRGDSSKHHTLEEAGVRRARSVVIADDDVDMARRITEVVRSLDTDVSVIVRTDHDGPEDLAASGADVVITSTRASAEVLRDAVVHDYFRGVTAEDVPAIDTRRVVTFAPEPGPCTHYAAVRPVLPSAPGCEECLESGDTWVHLRLCTQCGHVGCCDESPNRHARAHASPEHPIMRSLEPGDRWGWCFVDELELTERSDRARRGETPEP
jgi:CPA2 family monovalent cation:H+ antiporter-2